MKGLIIHPSFRIIGGAEVYALRLVSVLLDMYGEADLLTTSGLYHISHNKIILKRTNKKIFDIYKGIYRFYLNAILLKKIIGDVVYDYDYIINVKFNELPIGADLCVIHFPFAQVLYHWDKYRSTAGIDPKYRSSLHWRIYVAPFRKKFHKLTKKELKKCKIIIVNSRWTRRILYDTVGIDARVIYPPITFKPIRELKRKIDNLVVTISRYDPSKNLEMVLLTARKAKSAKFYVIGRVTNVQEYNYYRSLVRYRNVLKISNVKFLVNVDEKFKNAILELSRIYFHPTIGEHFGISVVEGMMYGAIPVVHSFGGPCTDIVESGRFGYCFDTIDEAVNYVNNIISGRARISFDVDYLRAKFGLERFRRMVADTIEEAARWG